MTEIVSKDTLTKLKALMGERYEKLVALYISSAGGLSEQLQAALAAGDVKALSEMAHALKSSSGNIGMTSISAHANEIERLCRQAQTFEEVSEEVAPRVSAIVRDYQIACVILKDSL